MKFNLQLECDNAAFGREPDFEVARILRDAADKLEKGYGSTGTITLRDINGNRCGSCAYEGHE
jgi:hypothetical protein